MTQINMIIGKSNINVRLASYRLMSGVGVTVL